jgi:hypothetical protein
VLIRWCKGRPQADLGLARAQINTARAKVKNLQRNPAFSLLVLDLLNPFRYLELRGDAELAPDPDYTFAAMAGAK